MQRILSLGLMAAVLTGILSACYLGSTPENPPGLLPEDVTALTLNVPTPGETYNTVGQFINYQYILSNTGNTALTGPVTVTDSRGINVTCPPINAVGDLNDNLDPGESITCSTIYTITQADLNAGSVTSNASAKAGEVISNTVTTTVKITLTPSLELSSTHSPTTYNAAGQTITFTFTVRNISSTPLGPAEFTIRADRLGTIICGTQGTSLPAGGTILCSSSYVTTDTDRNASELVFNAIASGGGATNTSPVTVVVDNTAVSGGTYTPGTTITHPVQKGEWMLQIARCYGADFKAVRDANPQVIDPAKIWPINTLKIPNIGSNGHIYGPPCVSNYPVQSGDTWESIANKFNADIDVLKEANKGLALTPGINLKVPNNSANGNPSHVPDEPIRITYPGGINVVTLNGMVTAAKGRAYYILTALQGQTLSIRLITPAADLQVSVYATKGNTLKARDATLTWTGIIPSNGDYIIEIWKPSGADRTYTLEAGLSTPVVTPTATQPPTTLVQRVADINPGPADGNPSHLAVFNNILYFSAIGLDNAGNELWKYDASANSITRAADIFLGTEGSNPTGLVEYNGYLYFSANGNDGAGVELWRYNGSAIGRLTDINGAGGNANPSYMTVFNGALYFSATGSDGAGNELWKTDGNTASRVTDIYNGGDSNPAYLTVYNNALYFSATSNDGAGTELWKYDGTVASRVTDINPGVGNANPAYLEVFNNILYFSANANDGFGTELWKYDGNAPSRAADINPGAGDSNPAFLTFFNTELYFSANSNDGTGHELWKFNGATPSRVEDLNKSGDSFPSFLAVYNNQLYFQANGGDGTGRELWRYKP